MKMKNDLRNLLEAMSSEDLRGLEQTIQEYKQEQAIVAKKNARHLIFSALTSAGLKITDLPELFENAIAITDLDKLTSLEGEAAPAAKRQIKGAEPKFQHPDDESIVWSGRGKTPVWITELLKNKRTPKQLWGDVRNWDMEP